MLTAAIRARRAAVKGKTITTTLYTIIAGMNGL